VKRAASAAAVAAALAFSLGGGGAVRLVRPEFGPAAPVRVPRHVRPQAALEVPQETRAAVALRPGQALEVPVDAAAGGRLALAFALAESPDMGFARVSVTAEGKLLHAKRVFAGRRDRWIGASVRLPRGTRALELRAEHVDRAGRRLPEEAVGEPWLLLAEPRLYVPSRGARRRVLIWISQDALRPDHLGSYGYQRPTSPRFDRLARESVLFERAASAASWTLPALASQFASRYPSYHGATRPDRAIGEHPTLFEVLARAGFTVLGVTGNLFVSAEFGTARGFDVLRFAPEDAAQANRLLLDALDQWPGGDLALFVHYMDPHSHFDPPPPFDRLFDPDYDGEVNGRNFYQRRLPPRDVEHVKALYDGEIAWTDRQLGALLDALAAGGLAHDALVVLSADHGEELQDHGGWTHSQTLYEEVLRIPLAIRLPGLAPRRVPQPVSSVDVAPTILDAFGIPAPPSFQGRSLLGLMRGQAREGRPIFAETEHTHGARIHKLALRDGRFKYVLETLRGDPALPVVRESLYDLASDPRERAPLPASERHERFREAARGFLARARLEAGGERSVRLPADVEEGLRALGYVR
jgi:arylsulfatase A-like enzyme